MDLVLHQRSGKDIKDFEKIAANESLQSPEMDRVGNCKE